MKATDVYLIGVGIRGFLHVTRESEDVLRRCQKVFLLAPDPFVEQFVKSLCPDVEDLYSLYGEDKPRRGTYASIVERIEQAAKKSPPVAFVTYGHPLVYVDPSRELLRNGHRKGLLVQALPGISALDCLFVDLGLDPAAEGMFMVEATDLLIRKRPLFPDVPTFVWQPGAVESILFTSRPNRPERFIRLRDHLLQFFPADHPVVIVTSAVNVLVESKKTTVELGKLETAAAQLHAGSSLYIPPVRPRPVQDHELNDLLQSEEHLQRITQ